MRCAQLAIRAFRAIDCQGLARVDFFLTEDGPVINEINTMPGFTTISMYPRMWAASGVDYPTLLATMVDTALRARARLPACVCSDTGVHARARGAGSSGLAGSAFAIASRDHLDRRRTRPLRQRQRHVDRPVDGEPGAASRHRRSPRNHCTASTT